MSNQALTQANQHLHRSNDNLQRFACVASHDLQEPLRKIQSFSMLPGQHMNEQLDETTRDYLERITRSASRMSLLITDLLSDSRIAPRQQLFGPISLNAVLAGLLETLSLEIAERLAQIQVDELPIVNRDSTQLSQLFQNLLSNALQFIPAGQVPQVKVEYVQRQLDELQTGVRPNRVTPFYHQTSVTDQGVGFDTKRRRLLTAGC
ncbi:sensor histidine kinase [Fibrella forsythiae]|uniref:histidine kinase n=1 Tax=Fibrella forsythiae TaxID=2817061 RepID=A0ABS3JNC1_9BACT|nr:histidine kinase dimerization/phospho-acceptor domain-containing protein [Fibrella forsythiae]MBO0950699.1 hypothetical protein [Fibrella forsythiae]